MAYRYLEWWLASEIDEAVNAASNIGYPVVLKAESAAIVHKSDKGGVVINLKSADEVRAAAEKMRNVFGEKGLKYLVQKFLPGGKELIAGVSTKPGLRSPGHVWTGWYLCGSAERCRI
jgi:acetyltransferase